MTFTELLEKTGLSRQGLADVLKLCGLIVLLSLQRRYSLHPLLQRYWKNRDLSGRMNMRGHIGLLNSTWKEIQKTRSKVKRVKALADFLRCEYSLVAWDLILNLPNTSCFETAEETEKAFSGELYARLEPWLQMINQVCYANRDVIKEVASESARAFLDLGKEVIAGKDWASSESVQHKADTSGPPNAGSTI